MESPKEGQRPNSGRGRVTITTVILAQLGSPKKGRGSTLSFPGRTIWGISARSARMTAYFQNRCHSPGRTNGGILRSLSLPLNDKQEWQYDNKQWPLKPEVIT